MTVSTGDATFAALFHSAPCGLVTANAQGIVTEVNQTLVSWTGRARDEIIGHPFGELLDTGSRLFYETRQVPVLQLTGAVEVSLAVRRADDTTLPVLINSVAITDPAGNTTSVNTALFDASSRQEYERELLLSRRAAEESEARVVALQDASTAFAAATTERDLADALAEGARVAFAAIEAGTFLLDEGRYRLAGGSYPLEQWIPVGSVGLGDNALAAGQVVTLGDLTQVRAASERLADAMEAAHVAAMSVAPMLEDGVAVGVLVCWFSRQRSFDSQFIELQEALARQAAQTLLRLRLQRQLERLALHDQLTGLANRALIQEEVDRAIAASRRHGLPMAVIFLDLDGFKAINDQLGHAQGDLVLRQVAERLRAAVRQHDTVGRFGGDEFVAVCEGIDQDAAASIGERIRTLVQQPFEGVPDSLPVTASVGVVVMKAVRETELSSDELLRSADDAMYRSKSNGKNQVTLALR